MKALHLQMPAFYRSAKDEKSALLFWDGREMRAGSILGYKCNQVSSDFGKIDKAAFSEPLASSDFSCRKILPVAINLA